MYKNNQSMDRINAKG